MRVDKKHFDHLVEKRLVNRQVHPNGNLWIYNYTPRCVYARAWDEYTLMARGLILDKQGEVVARPIPKFFNLEEHPRSDVRFSKPFTVHEKYDGSLGVLFCEDREWGEPSWVVARGSFSSDQARKASQILQEKYIYWVIENEDLVNEYTLCFEILYPANRIVVDYQGLEDLVLLAAINKEDGSELDLSNVDWPGPKADAMDMPEGARIPPHAILDHFAYMEADTKEGFVLKFDTKDGPFRIKVKFDEYKRLHALVTRTSSKTVWEYCSQGWDISDLLENVPDEFSDWVTEKYNEYTDQFKLIEATAQGEFLILMTGLGHDVGYWRERENRGKFAEEAKKTKYPAITFCMLDAHDWAPMAWKMIEPAHETPYANVSEENA